MSHQYVKRKLGAHLNHFKLLVFQLHMKVTGSAVGNCSKPARPLMTMWQRDDVDGNELCAPPYAV